MARWMVATARSHARATWRLGRVYRDTAGPDCHGWDGNTCCSRWFLGGEYFVRMCQQSKSKHKYRYTCCWKFVLQLNSHSPPAPNGRTEPTCELQIRLVAPFDWFGQ